MGEGSKFNPEGLPKEVKGGISGEGNIKDPLEGLPEEVEGGISGDDEKKPYLIPKGLKIEGKLDLKAGQATETPPEELDNLDKKEARDTEE